MSDIEIRHDPPRPFLCLQGLISADDIAGPINVLIARFEKAAAGLDGLGPHLALYHPQGTNPFGPDGEPMWIGRELLAQLNAPSGLQLNWTPGGEVAVAVGPNWERYGESTGDGEARTEVCYLLESQR